MEKATHTPTPWHVAEEIGTEGLWIDAPNPTNGEAEEICKLSEATLTSEEALANAEHIVLCVNAHDELIAMLKRCRDTFLSNTKAYAYYVGSDDAELPDIDSEESAINELLAKIGGAE